MEGQSANIGATAATAGLAFGNPALMIGGSLLGMFGGGSEKNPTAVLQDSINSILNRALENAIGTSTQYTNQAIGQQNASLSNATNVMSGYNQQAQKSAQGAMEAGFQRSQQLRQPYSRLGMNAADAYAKTLGLATPQGGSYQNQQNQQLVQQLSPLLKGLGGNYTLGDAPTAYQNVDPNSINIDQNAVNQMALQEFTKRNTGSGNSAEWDKALMNAAGQFVNNGDASVFSPAMTMYGHKAGSDQVNRANQEYSTSLTNLLAQYAPVYQQQQAAAQNAAGQAQYNQANQQYQQRSTAMSQLQSLLQGQNINQLAPLLRGKI